MPEIGIVGLHAENIGIENVLVDGETAEFEYYPHHQQQVENEKRWSSAFSPSSAADVAGSVYLSALEKELVPNLLINCCKPFKTESEQQEQPVSENGFHSSGEDKQVIFPFSTHLHLDNLDGLQFMNAVSSLGFLQYLKKILNLLVSQDSHGIDLLDFTRVCVLTRICRFL